MRDIYIYKNNFAKYRNIKSKMIIEGKVYDPEISIFIPTYNRANTIVDTLNSVINQIGNINFEVVVIYNDPTGEDCETRRIIQSLNDKRIYYYVNNKNIGLCGNWNRGLELCRSEYVTMIHDDDVLSPWFLMSMLKAIKENNKPLVIGVDARSFKDIQPEFIKPHDLKYRTITKRSYFLDKYITIAGMTVHRKSVISIGGYSEEYYPNEDTVLIYQAILKGKVVNIENELAGYRIDNNLSYSTGIMEKIIIIKEYTRRCIANHELFARIWMRHFDKEFLYLYICGANRFWNLNLEKEPIFSKFNLTTKINRVKLLLIKAWMKIYSLR